jgi:hypothetical protein
LACKAGSKGIDGSDKFIVGQIFQRAAYLQLLWHQRGNDPHVGGRLFFAGAANRLGAVLAKVI